MVFPNKILIASDHAAFKLKQNFKDHFSAIQWQDMGCYSEERVDYPDLAQYVCDNIEDKHMALLLCGSGQGMAMAANKHPHIRAALCWDEESTRLSRQHNNANILCLGARLLPPALCYRLFDLFRSTSFEGGRHSDRVKKFSSI